MVEIRIGVMIEIQNKNYLRVSRPNAPSKWRIFFDMRSWVGSCAEEKEWKEEVKFVPLGATSKSHFSYGGRGSKYRVFTLKIWKRGYVLINLDYKVIWAHLVKSLP